MKNLRTLFYSVDFTQKEKYVLLGIDEAFNENFDAFEDVFQVLNQVNAAPSKKVLDKIFSEI